MRKSLLVPLLSVTWIQVTAAQRGLRSVCRIEVAEASIADLRAALLDGRANSVGLVDAYLARIAAYDQRGPRLNAIVRLNPRARVEAAARDAERAAGRAHGLLHGIPVLIKDNYDTKDLETSAGTVALATWIPPDDAYQVKKLRQAGAIILGKTNMHELASGISTISSIGGQTLNPYDLRRTPGGSSGGAGAAAATSFAAVAYGSDTCGSIRIPSAFNNLFGLRPTKGLTSVAGILPLAHSQDVAGPLARTVTDLAIALDATVGPDVDDPATAILQRRAVPSFSAHLDTTALRGARFGVLKSSLGDKGEDREVARLVKGALAQMVVHGAQLVDVELPLADSVFFQADVTNYEFKFDLMDYLASRPNAPVHSLHEILARGQYDVALDGALRRRDSTVDRDSKEYRSALERRAVVLQALMKLLDDQHLDALVYPTAPQPPAIIGEAVAGASCLMASVTGMPALSMPAGFSRRGLPIGLEMLGRPLDDAKLVSFAYAYEQAVHPRFAPSTTPPLVKGAPPSPTAYLAIVRSPSGETARGLFVFDRTTNTLRYQIHIAARDTGQLVEAVISRGAGEQPGPILHRLTRQGERESSGVIVLQADERGDLASGHLYLNLYTRRAIAGVRAALKPTSSRRERT